MVRKFLSVCLLVCLLAALPLSAEAKQFDHTQKGSISVTMTSQHSGTPMAGAEFSVYYIANVGINTYGEINYRFTDEYQERDFELEDPDLVQKLDTFVQEQTVTSRKITTDVLGKAVCDDLELGLYFVKQTGMVYGFAPCASFLVSVPYETETEYLYHVNATPKTDVVKLVDITVKKVWNTGTTAGLPTSVTVLLMHNNKEVGKVELNKNNGWQHTFTNMPESDSYSIKEEKIPLGYYAAYFKDDYEFTVMNTPGLAQTGQLIWPIPLFALAGVFFLMMGFVILRKPGKENA